MSKITLERALAPVEADHHRDWQLPGHVVQAGRGQVGLVLQGGW